VTKGEDAQAFGRAVEARRGELGMTQQELADAAGVDLKTVYNLESGGRRPIARVRAAISGVLGWSDGALAAVPARDDGPPDPDVFQDCYEIGIDPFNPDDPWMRSVRQDIADAIMRYGAGATGVQIFGGRYGRVEVTIWDDPTSNRRTKEAFIAWTRADRQLREAGRTGRQGTAGLALRLIAGVT
jgi:transcriptional regulator with XRE-family HTH domain